MDFRVSEKWLGIKKASVVADVEARPQAIQDVLRYRRKSNWF